MTAVPTAPPDDREGRDREGPILRVEDLQVTFYTPGGRLQAVCGIDLELQPGEVLGIVGESGSGKSVSAMSLIGLLPSGGNVEMRASLLEFEGIDLMAADASTLRSIRGRRVGTIFQDPLTSLNPTKRIGTQLTEAPMLHEQLSRGEAEKRAVDLLRLVGMSDPEDRLRQYPHELSGGMRQRAMIAMALCKQPSLLIADEPTTALDVTVEAQILELLQDLRRRLQLAILLISHDIGVVAEMADRIAVMYAGRIVEIGATERVLHEPAHPYTQALLAAIPHMEDGGRVGMRPIRGNPPDPLAVSRGCAFAPRCDHVRDRCREANPQLLTLTGQPRLVSCFAAHESETRPS